MKKRQELQRFELRVSGLGGQGVITLGKILGSGLALGHGYFVTQTQSYGPEARGGTSRADLVVSSQAISYPKTESLDMLVALSQEACNTYFRALKPGGVLLVDSTFVKQTPTNHYLGLPFTELVRERVGNPMTLNIMVLGAVTHILPFAEARLMRKAVEENFPLKIQPVNLKAFTLGLQLAKKHFGAPADIWATAKEHAHHSDDFKPLE